ncbi:TetR/AcrR family transcriptional regulator [Patulibacter minatonensis]|uniref:TetR/AcrR family transcriptional regulator n=1 Tax=Patulibacter minatonensis TaxID=298163 RepID=UPI0004B12347|nr:TetR/AcrR family transcriptional regulator [Patulibacter minatonensis]
MAGADDTGGGRRYGGRSTEERRAERRARLLDAALDVVGTRGWAEATMTEICRVAGLTERYFYESFRTREALYGALLDDLDRELRAAAFDAIAAGALEPVARVEVATRAIVGLYVGDPRRGRAALVEGIGVRELEEQRRRTVAGLFGLLAERWTLFFPDSPISADERRRRATAIGGATIALITGRIEGTLAIDDAALVAAIVGTTVAIATAPDDG